MLRHVALVISASVLVAEICGICELSMQTSVKYMWPVEKISSRLVRCLESNAEQFVTLCMTCAGATKARGQA